MHPLLSLGDDGTDVCLPLEVLGNDRVRKLDGLDGGTRPFLKVKEMTLLLMKKKLSLKLNTFNFYSKPFIVLHLPLTKHPEGTSDLCVSLKWPHSPLSCP